MAMSSGYQNWTIHVDDKNVLWLAVDRHNSSVNSLNQAVLEELDAILDEIADEDKINSVIIYSAKKTGFIAGADVSQFTKLQSAEEAFQLIRQGQLVFNKLAALPKVTVAMIDGFCLGGGLELALACRYRVAEDSHHTRLGLPEVYLGLQPGWGGTVRLPLLIGATNAMKLILTGKIISAKEAEKLGVIDAALPRRVLEKGACHYALKPPKPHEPTFIQTLSNRSFARPLLANVFMKNLKVKIKEEHYPAPFAVVRNWEEFGPESSQALMQEARSIGKLMVHPTGRNLIRGFFLKERLKSLAKGLSFKAKHVHVIGAGTMGSAIAGWCAFSGLTVTLQDQTPKLLAAGIKRAHDIIKQKLKSKRELTLAMDRLVVDINGLGIPRADVVIEAIIENLDAKHALYRDIESKMKPDALLATNTSSLPLSELRKALQSPERLVVIHFFNPVDKMELVEVAADTEANNRSKDAIAFVRQINRLPLPVLSKPGFLVNRILMPYLMESMMMLKEGIPGPVIDKAAKDFGMPMGPIELADRVGLDICLSVAETLTQHYGGEVPSGLRSMVSEGKLGTKSGQGFYQYRKGKALKPLYNVQNAYRFSSQDIQDRLIFRILNESVACLRESIVSDEDLLDAGMIFGTGFAPFRGGPIHYAKAQNIAQIQQRFLQLQDQFGDRFKPDIGWQILGAEAGAEPFKSNQNEEVQKSKIDSKYFEEAK
jgi:3-hydroxyacyl-CoA dehydrogenase / enoyl-CoA hydratase / 3-hydroxybutyryl-CoA epimerase